MRGHQCRKERKRGKRERENRHHQIRIKKKKEVRGEKERLCSTSSFLLKEGRERKKKTCRFNYLEQLGLLAGGGTRKKKGAWPNLRARKKGKKGETGPTGRQVGVTFLGTEARKRTEKTKRGGSTMPSKYQKGGGGGHVCSLRGGGMRRKERSRLVAARVFY